MVANKTGVITTVYKDESRTKGEGKDDDQFNQTAWTSYFKDALAFQETVDAPKTSDFEVLGKKVTAEESQKILVRLGVLSQGQSVSLDQVNAHWESPVENAGDSRAIKILKVLIQRVKNALNLGGVSSTADGGSAGNPGSGDNSSPEAHSATPIIDGARINTESPEVPTTHKTSDKDGHFVIHHGTQLTEKKS